MQNPPRKFPNITINITILSLCSLRNRILGGNMSFSASLRLFCAWQSFEQRPSFHNTMWFFICVLESSASNISAEYCLVSFHSASSVPQQWKSDSCVCKKISDIVTGQTDYRLLKGNVWRKIFSLPKKRCGKRSTLFSRCFIRYGLR